MVGRCVDDADLNSGGNPRFQSSFLPAFLADPRLFVKEPDIYPRNAFSLHAESEGGSDTQSGLS
jgi:hypothetical protein